MRSKLIFISLIGLLLTGLDVSQNSIGFTTAQSQEDNSQRKTKKTGSMTEKVAKKLGEAQELIEDEKLDEGVEILNDILGFKRLSPYERGQVNYFFAYVRYLENDLEGAIIYYKRVAEDPNVPDGLIESAKFTIAQLYFQTEDWPKVITAVDSLLIDQPNRTDLYILKGSAMYQQKQYEEMIPIINKAISIAEEANAFRLEQLQRNILETASKYRVQYDRDEVDFISLASQLKVTLKEELARTR
ncbi:MAG: hypothetical protein NZ776_05635, partial [SAR86 cluster bacterium]|nr:hypothetical protein [SAR86 cluster bacterium]